MTVQSQANPLPLRDSVGLKGDLRRKKSYCNTAEAKEVLGVLGQVLADVCEEGDHPADFSVNLCPSCQHEE